MADHGLFPDMSKRKFKADVLEESILPGGDIGFRKVKPSMKRAIAVFGSLFVIISFLMKTDNKLFKKLGLDNED